jgi:hypothetical protein
MIKQKLQFMRTSKAKYRDIHFKRPIHARGRDEFKTEPLVENPEDWIGKEDFVDIRGLDDELPSNMYIRKERDQYSIGFTRIHNGRREYIPTTAMDYSRDGSYKNAYYVSWFRTIRGGSRPAKGMGTYLMREFLKDADEDNSAVHLMSMSGTEQGLGAESRSRLYESFGFHFDPRHGYARDREGGRYGGMVRPPHSKARDTNYRLERVRNEDLQLEIHSEKWDTKGEVVIIGDGYKKEEPKGVWLETSNVSKKAPYAPHS